METSPPSPIVPLKKIDVWFRNHVDFENMFCNDDDDNHHQLAYMNVSLTCSSELSKEDDATTKNTSSACSESVDLYCYSEMG